NLIPYLQPPQPDFTITANPSSLTINSGSSGSSTITITSVNGFSGTVSLASSPSSSSTLDTSSVAVPAGGSASATLSMTPTSSTTYAVNGTAGSISHSINVAVTVLTVPYAPQNLQTTSGNAQVSLSWSAPSNNGGSAITNYNIYRSTSSGSETFIATTGNVLSYTDSGLTNGQTYYYKVTAINSVGESLSSNEASATPQLPALSVSVTTDKPVYSKGSASITVTVTNSTSSPISGASVTLTVKAPNGNTSQSTGTTNSNGQVTFSYHMTKPGTYTASASANKSGYLSDSGSTAFIKT
ncbi:MAG: hypothetical protein E6K87_03605, partial [Thaumarchaeota archaeon]